MGEHKAKQTDHLMKIISKAQKEIADALYSTPLVHAFGLDLFPLRDLEKFGLSSDAEDRSFRWPTLADLKAKNIQKPPKLTEIRTSSSGDGLTSI